MEEKSKKKIYFIFSQKAGEIIDYEIEKNEIIDEIKILKQDNTSDYIYKLYSISLNNIPISKSFSILHLQKDNISLLKLNVIKYIKRFLCTK